MILKVFTLQDLKAGMFMQPFFFPSVGQATRFIQDMASDMQNILARHPGDFVLYQVGEWDDASARFTCEHPVHIAAVTTLLPVKDN